VKLLLLAVPVFISGCWVGAGSPQISISKNLYVIDSCNNVIGYSTESKTTSDADIVQEFKDLFKAPAPKPGPGLGLGS